MVSPAGRRLRTLVLTPLAATIASLVVIELLVRLLGLAPTLPDNYYTTDPHLPFKPRPLSHITGRSSTDEFDLDYRHNSLGFRDVERPWRKPPGVCRIVALGDSFTYGAGVPFEETYLVQLERMLDTRPGAVSRFEIVKMGIPRFFPEAERLLLEHYGLGFEPDVILVTFVPNDVIDTYLGLGALAVSRDGYLLTSEGARLVRDLPAPLARLYTASHAFRLVLGRIASYRVAQAQPIKWNDVYRADGFHEKDWREVERQFRAMSRLARQHRVPLLLVHIPMKGDLDAPQAAYPARRLAALAAEESVAFVDTLPALRAAAQTAPAYWPRDGHPNARGAAVIARTLYAALVDDGPVIRVVAEQAGGWHCGRPSARESDPDGRKPEILPGAREASR
jgi:lysophospholipase L1-like esterase